MTSSDTSVIVLSMSNMPDDLGRPEQMFTDLPIHDRVTYYLDSIQKFVSESGRTQVTSWMGMLHMNEELQEHLLETLEKRLIDWQFTYTPEQQRAYVANNFIQAYLDTMLSGKPYMDSSFQGGIINQRVTASPLVQQGEAYAYHGYNTKGKYSQVHFPEEVVLTHTIPGQEAHTLTFKTGTDTDAGMVVPISTSERVPGLQLARQVRLVSAQGQAPTA